MKNFFKWSAITAGVLLAVGMILAFICGVAGGRKAILALQDYDGWDSVSQAIESADHAISNISGGHWHILWNGNNPTALIFNGERITAGRTETCMEAQGIKNLDLTLGAGTFIIEEKKTDDGVIDLSVAGAGDCNYQIEGDTLLVEGFHGIGIGNRVTGNEIVLKVPKGMAFHTIEIEAGAGEMRLSGLDAEELDATIGAGEMVLQEAAVTNFVSEIGAGRLQAEGMDVKNAEISVSMGECIYQGFIRKDLDAECNMGNVEFMLKGNEKEHNYEIECDAGNIDMKDLHMTAFAGERSIDNGTDSNFDITCNMGNITLEFEEE